MLGLGNDELKRKRPQKDPQARRRGGGGKEKRRIITTHIFIVLVPKLSHLVFQRKAWRFLIKEVSRVPAARWLRLRTKAGIGMFRNSEVEGEFMGGQSLNVIPSILEK